MNSYCVVNVVWLIILIELGATFCLTTSIVMNFYGLHDVHGFSICWLVQDYMEMLRRDIHRRLQGESGQDNC